MGSETSVWNLAILSDNEGIFVLFNGAFSLLDSLQHGIKRSEGKQDGSVVQYTQFIAHRILVRPPYVKLE